MTDTCISVCSCNFRPGSNRTFCTWKVFYELHHARATRGLEGPEMKGESEKATVLMVQFHGVGVCRCGLESF